MSTYPQRTERITNEGTVFIPDITGFTKFVTETEIKHSRLIIQELLELIIDNTTAGFEVIEIEGDAVLFHKEGAAPPLLEMAAISEQMFTAFKAHLMAFDRDRLCNCEACTTAKRLSLKMVVTYGSFERVEVKGHKKLLGRDIIVAHRLLKNSIQSGEYMLLCETYLSTQNEEDTAKLNPWIELERGVDHYNEIGPVPYRYYLFTPLIDTISPPKRRPPAPKYSLPVTAEIEIEADLNFVFNALTDLDIKQHLFQNIDHIEVEEEHAPRVGDTHQCIFTNRALNITTIDVSIHEKKIEFSDEAENFPVLKKVINHFVLEKKGNRVKVTQELHFKKVSIQHWIKYLMIYFPMRKQFKKQLKTVKNYCERHSQKSLDVSVGVA